MIKDKIKEFKIPVVDSINSFETIESLISYTRALEDAEGFVIAFDNGHRLKIKADQYVRIHKTVDRIRFDRHIVDLILNEEVDDVLPMLPKHEADRLHTFAKNFGERLHATVENYERYWNTVVASGLDRKRYAQEWMPTIKVNDSFAPQYVFGRFAGHNGRDMILQHIAKHLTSNVKWNECAKWLGMECQ